MGSLEQSVALPAGGIDRNEYSFNCLPLFTKMFGVAFLLKSSVSTFFLSALWRTKSLYCAVTMHSLCSFLTLQGRTARNINNVLQAQDSYYLFSKHCTLCCIYLFFLHFLLNIKDIFKNHAYESVY